MKELLLYGGILLSPDYSCIRSRSRRRWVGWMGGLNSASHGGAEGAKEKKWETMTTTTARLFIRLPHRVETAGSRRTLPTSQRPNNNATKALVSQ